MTPKTRGRRDAREAGENVNGGTDKEGYIDLSFSIVNLRLRAKMIIHHASSTILFSSVRWIFSGVRDDLCCFFFRRLAVLRASNMVVVRSV